jgi:membrane associated rhomboid family serine protease
VKIPTHGLEIDSCTSCFGVWFSKNELPEFLEKLKDEEFSAKPDNISSTNPVQDIRSNTDSFCPQCNQPVLPYSVGNSDNTVLKCSHCSGIWADISQIGPLRKWYRDAKESERLSIRAMWRQPKNPAISFASVPRAIFNLVDDDIDRNKFPAITFFIIAVNILIFFWSYFYPHKAIFYLNVPETFFDYPLIYAYTLLASMFMHAGIFHLLFNMYFLWVFGDNVEDRIGPAKFIIFYLCCGIFAGLIHTIFTIHPQYPTLGASGAVSGIMGGYLILYPKVKLNFHTLLFIIPLKLRIPVWFYLGVWFFGFQLINAYLSIPGIAWYAHIGGFIFGFVTMFGMRKLNYL